MAAQKVTLTAIGAYLSGQEPVSCTLHPIGTMTVITRGYQRLEYDPDQVKQARKALQKSTSAPLSNFAEIGERSGEGLVDTA